MDGVVSVVVLDSALEPAGSQGADEGAAQCAAMVVPLGREHDWMYATEGGQWQLLASAAVSRMILFCCHLSHDDDDDAAAATAEAGHETACAGGTNPSPPPSRQKARKKEQARSWQRSTRGDWRGTSSSSSSSRVRGEQEQAYLETSLSQLVQALVPKSLLHRGVPPPFVSYTDNVLRRVVVEECFSPTTGLMVVEDVEVRRHDGCVESGDCVTTSSSSGSKSGGRERRDWATNAAEGEACERWCCCTEVRRRLRFQRMPNLIQSEVRLSAAAPAAAGAADADGIGGRCEPDMVVDHGVLVHKYLAPIVAGLVLAAPCLDACAAAGAVAKVLCIGVGGGALPSFLHRHFPFNIQAVDLDAVVLRLAGQHFALREDRTLQVTTADGLRLVDQVAQAAVTLGLASGRTERHLPEDTHPAAAAAAAAGDATTTPSSSSSAHEQEDPRYHVIVVDVDAGDPKLDVSSPPAEFLSEHFLRSARTSLCSGGMLALNVVALNHKSFDRVVCALKEVFAHVYALDVEDDVHQVVFGLQHASSSSSSSNSSCQFVGPLASRVEKVVGTDLGRRIRRL